MSEKRGKLWKAKSYEKGLKSKNARVMSETRKRRQEALNRLFTLLAWPPSSYFHIFQALFPWKQSHIFWHVASCPSWWICYLYPLWHLFLKIRWPNLNQRVSDKRNLNHIHMFNAKSLMTFFGRPCHQFRPTVVSNHQPCQMWRRDRCKNLDGSITSVMPVSYSEKLNINFIE